MTTFCPATSTVCRRRTVHAISLKRHLKMSLSVPSLSTILRVCWTRWISFRWDFGLISACSAVSEPFGLLTRWLRVPRRSCSAMRLHPGQTGGRFCSVPFGGLKHLQLLLRIFSQGARISQLAGIRQELSPFCRSCSLLSAA